ncbi:hypothetical protein ASPTUDRAFT_806707 [Aspergillus tubingensis CBS 134.48]|uniref:Uncharacterized protein n=1 Tax=Aspergillus tubingensis (strain CBS 134.48) TaxID=767770 RepID=A0A1L9MVV1_ASPTC|nr:hypothetical protein ASPTUDRAFT_806707 [Aspergillus tubingensis CBS 134.48]
MSIFQQLWLCYALCSSDGINIHCILDWVWSEAIQTICMLYSDHYETGISIDTDRPPLTSQLYSHRSPLLLSLPYTQVKSTCCSPQQRT